MQECAGVSAVRGAKRKACRRVLIEKNLIEHGVPACAKGGLDSKPPPNGLPAIECRRASYHLPTNVQKSTARQSSSELISIKRFLSDARSKAGSAPRERRKSDSMARAIPFHVQLQEQRHLIEEQQIEMRHQRHQMNLQARRIVDLQAELDTINANLRRKAPNLPVTQEATSNSNGRRAEEQQIEIRRQRRQMELQFKRIVDLQAELDTIKATLGRTASTSILQFLQGTQKNGNGRRTAHHRSSEAISSSSQT